MTDEIVIYQVYAMNMPEADCRAEYIKRYGVEPQVSEFIEYPTKIRGVAWGFWRLGPVPIEDGRPVYNRKDANELP